MILHLTFVKCIFDLFYFLVLLCYFTDIGFCKPKLVTLQTTVEWSRNVSVFAELIFFTLSDLAGLFSSPTPRSEAGLGNCVVDSLQGYNADISHNVSKRLARPHLWEPCAPKKTRVPAAPELPSKFVLGTAEEDIGSSVLVAAEKIKGRFKLRTTSTMRKPGSHRELTEAGVWLAQHMVLVGIHGAGVGTGCA